MHDFCLSVVDEPDAATHTPVSSPPPGPVQAVPELPHPGESASNGLAERSVRAVEDLARTILAALQSQSQDTFSWLTWDGKVARSSIVAII